MSNQDYDNFSVDYDKFVNWEARLGVEMPFLEGRLSVVGKKAKVCDSACGTGMHAIALAERGYTVSGADVSRGMIDRARMNAALTGQEVRFEQAGFGELASVFGVNEFDALLCLGNSLPHVIGQDKLEEALTDFMLTLRSGGLLIIQNRNFDRIVVKKERWMAPQTYQEGNHEWLFMRFYDYLPQGTINFNIITLHRTEGGDWRQSITSTILQPYLQEEIYEALRKAGFQAIKVYGNMMGDLFERLSSDNLVIVAQKG